MTPERIAELKNRPIDFSDIPEIKKDDASQFYFRKNRLKYQKVCSLFDKENFEWLEKYGDLNKATINQVLNNLREEIAG